MRLLGAGSLTPDTGVTFPPHQEGPGPPHLDPKRPFSRRIDAHPTIFFPHPCILESVSSLNTSRAFPEQLLTLFQDCPSPLRAGFRREGTGVGGGGEVQADISQPAGFLRPSLPECGARLVSPLCICPHYAGSLVCPTLLLASKLTSWSEVWEEPSMSRTCCSESTGPEL